jgi:putative colanic acid biosynthesis acetyltransferase WcaF
MVDLANYDNRTYDPQRGLWMQAAWFFFGLPLLRCRILPFSGVRTWVLRLFGAKIGTGVVIRPGVRVKYPWLLSIGDHSWLGEDCWIDNLVLVTIGSNACLSQGCYLCTGNHNWADVGFTLITKPITVCDGAWVGARALVAPGLTVGECAILTAGSVGKKDIPPYEIHDGNPAHFVKKRRFANAEVHGWTPAPRPVGAPR